MKVFIAYGLLITALFAAAGYRGYTPFANSISGSHGPRGYSHYHK